MTAALQALHDRGLNPFAAELLAESLLKQPKPETVEFFLEIDRRDCAGWKGVKFRLEPVSE